LQQQFGQLEPTADFITLLLIILQYNLAVITDDANKLL